MVDKLSDEILRYVQEQAAAEPGIKAEEMARRVRQRFAVKLHSRTIQKGLGGSRNSSFHIRSRSEAKRKV